MKYLYVLLVLIELSGLGYGVYSELAPDDWPLKFLPEGMGAAIALIAVVMAPTALELYTGKVDEEKNSSLQKLLEQSTGKVTVCHERDFYHNWPTQLTMAKNTVDITHLGIKPPKPHHDSETDYFKRFKKLVKSTKAHVRKVERFAEDKKEWIEKLAHEMKGVRNFSLAVYRDPIGEEETPAAVSVCRVDDQIAWIIALAEHQSTIDVRDIMILDAQAVRLVSLYFQKRLWDRSAVVVSFGDLDVAKLTLALK